MYRICVSLTWALDGPHPTSEPLPKLKFRLIDHSIRYRTAHVVNQYANVLLISSRARSARVYIHCDDVNSLSRIAESTRTRSISYRHSARDGSQHCACMGLTGLGSRGTISRSMFLANIRADMPICPCECMFRTKSIASLIRLHSSHVRV